MASAIPFIAQDFHLSSTAMGSVLSAFFVGYAAMQIPGGLLADRFGPKAVMTFSVVCWSMFTAVTGIATSLRSVLAIRVVFGLCEGPYPPSASKMIAMIFPQHEIGRANGLQLAAVNIGAAVAPLFVAPLIMHWGWRTVFYSLLPPGLILAFVIKFSTKETLHKTNHNDFHDLKSEQQAVPIGELLKFPALVWCSITLFFANIASWGLMNWLPTYLLQARGFSTAKMGMFAPLPFVAGAIGYYLGGYVSDKYFSKSRKVPVMLALMLGGGMTYLAATASSGEWAVAALIPAFLFLFIASAGLFTLPLVISPPGAVGKAFGIVNTVGQISAFLSPLLIGSVLDATDQNYTVVFYGLVGFCIVASLAAYRIKQPPKYWI